MPFDQPALPRSEARAETVIIDRRFRGPVASGNGGYVCGLLGKAFSGAAEATLTAPPPLEKPLTLRADGPERALADGEKLLGKARAAALDIDPPAPVSIEEALDAAETFPGHAFHLHPECFVCGTHRGERDGLRLFTGPLPDGRAVASAFLPDPIDSDAEGRTRPEIIWAALDCPGYFALGDASLNALLGRMTAEIYTRPRPNEPCVVMGWKLGQEGRKHFAGSALYSYAGELLAMAKQVWIELKAN